MSAKLWPCVAPHCGALLVMEGFELTRRERRDSGRTLSIYKGTMAVRWKNGYSAVSSKHPDPVLGPATQRDVVRRLYRMHGPDEQAVCSAFVEAEQAGEAVRKAEHPGLVQKARQFPTR